MLTKFSSLVTPQVVKIITNFGQPVMKISSAWHFRFDVWVTLYTQENDGRQLIIDGLVLDCSICSALTIEILQCCTKPSLYTQALALSNIYITHFQKYFLNKCRHISNVAHCSLRDVEASLQMYFWNLFYELISWALSVKLVWCECHRLKLKIS